MKDDQAPHQTNIDSVIHSDETGSASGGVAVLTNGHANGNGKSNGRVKLPAEPVEKKSARLNNAPGLKIDRLYTKAGENVYDTVEWELRDALITNERGEKVFEQKNVEIPKSWTQLATNVVVSKYFRGHVGTPQREYSVRQLIGRVADTMANWGRGMDYFASEADAQAFQDELTHILLHQKAAFNSPVWFNVGLSDQPQPQCSACFINSVEDTMDSILTLAKTEGMLFKFGSGTGTNLSTIRGSHEKLNGGGTASGPLSFMRGFDQFAGAIKSGGKTRRAAKMVILNIDHPDIMDFITSKEKEERKAWTLIDAGYSGMFNVPGGAYDSVHFQNANHSVRVSDEFMEAYEKDVDWTTRFVTDKRPAQQYKARDVMKLIGQSAWVCGDPGMQYDSTINKWHTCKNTDRIHSSNPCVTGDTLVATDDGWQRIDSLVGKSARIIGADGQPHFVTEIFKTGVKQVYRLRTRAGYEVRITGNHQVLTTERGDVAVADLKIGEHLTLQGAGFGRTTLSDSLALAIGVALGDGCLTRSMTTGNLQEIITLTMAAEESAILNKIAVEVNAKKQELRVPAMSGRRDNVNVKYSGREDSVSRLSFSSQPVVSLFKEYAVLDEGSEGKRFTPNIFDIDRASLASVLRGLFTADGTVANYGDKSQYIALDSTSHEMLKQVQLLLLSFGIKAKLYTERRGGVTEALLPDSLGIPRLYPVKEMHSLRISRSSRFLFEREIGFDPDSPKAADLSEMNAAFSAYRDFMTDEIEAIKPEGEEAVYDLTEPITHHFVANGLVVHNCSEYMFLNDSACNLASLNLMKFRRPDASLDVDSFNHACRILITAQEIIIDNASYPTPRIGENSHDYRPLGLGYANLGALLMANGLPYDSDEGRAYAGAITAMMTGEAYYQSSVIARDHGWAFPGYAKNRQPFLEVMRMHRAAVETIDSKYVPDEMLNSARKSWDNAITSGEAHGYRNAQATVLAPTGCLVGNSLIVTNRGLVRLRSLGNPDGEKWQKLHAEVATDNGPKLATQFYVNGAEPVVTVETARGYRIQGTPMHRAKVVDQNGDWVWRRFSDIRAGDRVPMLLNGLVGNPNPVPLPPLSEAYWTSDYSTIVPRQMTADLAEFIGYFMGDGSLHSKGIRLCVAKEDIDVVERLSKLGNSLFGLTPSVTEQKGYTEVALNSVRLTLWWEACGFAKHLPTAEHSGKGYTAHIPDAILHSNDSAVYAAFTKGLFEADGTATNGYVSWSTVNETFSRDMQTLLLTLGFVTTRKTEVTNEGRWGKNPLYVLRLLNVSSSERFSEEVGFLSKRKQEALFVSGHPQASRYDQIPVSREMIDELAPENDSLRKTLLLSMARTGTVSRRAANELMARSNSAKLGNLLRFFYDDVKSAVLGEEQFTYDISVPENVTYIANGFISHNTIGFLMDCDTTGIEPDIAIVKYKNLVGGGVMKIVNNTVPEALQRLGYTAFEMENIIDYIDKHETIEGAPDLKDEHLPIFDCAFKPGNGERSIHHMGHVKMMAAAQPFISGAISKTVNMPHNATAEEIVGTYMEGWKLGLKAIAIYRDGSKRTQPLMTKKGDAETEKDALSTAAPIVQEERKPLRRKLPDERHSITHKFSIAGHEGYITVGMYADGKPGEIFLTMSKEGSTISGLMDSFATAISLALQYGVPLQTLVDKFAYTRFEPSGITNNPDVRFAKSIMDYIFRWLGAKFLNRLPVEDAKSLENPEESIMSNNMATSSLPTLTMNSFSAPITKTEAEHEMTTFQNQMDAPICVECGSLMVRNGACYKCLNCGSVYGCS